MSTVTAPPPGTRRVLGSPAAAVRQVTRSAGTTPGRLSVIAIGLVLLTVLAISMQQKSSTIDNLVNHREPLAAAAQQLYRSLSDADATAAGAFLAGDKATDDIRNRYDLDIAQAGAALSKASTDVSGLTEAEGQVRLLTQQLPIYTSLVERARAETARGFPIGSAYLREASGLMRDKILPAAESLYNTDFQRLGDEQSDARSFPWFAAILAVLLLAALIATQLYLTRKTNRLINVGLFVATVAVVLGLAWSSVALLVGSSDIADGQRTGSEQVQALVNARITTLKMRADETLTLIARGEDNGAYDKDFAALRKVVSDPGSTNPLVEAKNLAASQQVAGDVQAAVDNTNAWLAAHDRIGKAPDYPSSVDVAINTGKPDSAATAFGKLDGNLLTALQDGRQEFVNSTLSAGRAMTGLLAGMVVLAALAAAGIIMGIAQRLREYR
jgi:hypothetical protein